MSDLTPTPASTYAQAAADADAVVDEKLSNIRFAENDGHLTATEAASQRITAMEMHLQTIKLLRALYFPEDDEDPGWISGTSSTE